MKLTHIMSNFFLNYIVSEAAKTFGKSQNWPINLPENFSLKMLRNFCHESRFHI